MLSLILAAVCVFGNLANPQTNTAWSPITSSEGRFSALMPDEIRSTNTLFTDTREGRLMTNLVSTTDQYLNEYLVSWTDYPDQASIEKRGSDKTFNRIRDAYARSRDLTVFQEASLTSQGYPARTYSMRTSDGKRIIRVQIYFVKNRFYQVSADTRVADSTDGEKFLNSFKLLSGTLI